MSEVVKLKDSSAIITTRDLDIIELLLLHYAL